MLNDKIKGYGLALIGAIALANSFIFSKTILNEISFVHFGLIWFAAGLIWLILYIFLTGEYREIRRLKKAGHIYTFLVGLFEALGTAFFYIALNRVDNPAVVSFLGNAGPVFVTLMGIFLLRERYSGLELFGVIIAISGIFTMAFQGGSALGNVFIEGTEWIILASLMFATGTIIGRKQIHQVSPSFLSFIRVLLLLVVFIGLQISTREQLILTPKIIFNVGLGSFLEALVTMVAAYSALKYIQAVRMSILISTKSIWILISAFIFFGLFPSPLQLLGGGLSLIGVILLSVAHPKKN
jgi:drug/metabolite transporter (DMT)-like permease